MATTIVLNCTLTANGHHPSEAAGLSLADLDAFMDTFTYLTHSLGFTFHGHATLELGTVDAES